MRIKKKISLVRYLMICCVVLISVFGVLMLSAINIVTDDAARQAVKSELSAQMHKAARSVVYEEGVIREREDAEKLDHDFYFVILDEDGRTLLYGTYPEEFDEKVFDGERMDEEIRYFQEIENGGQTYYMSTRRGLLRHLTKEEKGYYLRGIIREKDIRTIYQKMKWYAYAGIGIAVVGMIMVGLLLRKQISYPLQNMCEQASRISENLDLSERMEYSGRFQELDVLISAYNKLLARMEKVVERQEQFNSDVSHELMTPITVIRAQCQLAQEQLAREREISLEKTLGVIVRQSDKMDRIVEQLLQLSRMDQGRMMPDIEEVDLVDIVESVCEDQEDACDCRFVYDLHPAVVYVDIALITVAVRNLVSNAVKYGPKGVAVEVSCGRKERGSYVRVKDYGDGIAPEELPRIFEHYYRAEKSRNSEGFGLGLTIAMKIAQIHGGTIHAESDPGKGTEFILVIPTKN